MSEIKEKNEPLNKNNKVPKLRFRNFNDDWIVCNFKDHFNTFSTNSLSWDQLNYENGQIKNLHYGIIHSNSNNILASNTLPFINIESIPKRYELLKNGDLILADTSEDRIDAAKGVEISNPSNDKIISGLHTLHLREKKKKTIEGYKSYFVASKSFRYFARKYCEGIKVFSIKLSLLKYTYFAYPSNIEEQYKIVDLFNKLTLKQDLIQKKINILKKYKKGLYNYAHEYVKKHGDTYIFKDLFLSVNEKNTLSLKQYTVGKYGLKEMDEGRYDISNHKVFYPTNLIVGIGIEEIGISEHTKGSVSPIYDVFSIKNNVHYDSLRITLKDQLWNKRNFITKKSTRREYEVDKKELLKMQIYVCDNTMFDNITKCIDLNKKTVELLEQKLNCLIKIKNYLLNNMFT